MQIFLADYSAYLHELQVSCTLWSILRSISGWFMNFKSLFSKSVPPLNLNKLTVHTRCWSACKLGVVFLLFTLPSWCQISWYVASRWHTTQLSICRYISLYEKLSTPQNLPYLKQSLGEILGEDCRLLSTIRCEWWNRATGFAIPGFVFDPLLAVICFW